MHPLSILHSHSPLVPDVDFHYQMAYREQVLSRYQDMDWPKYFLAPQLRALANLPTINEHQRMLLLLLWNTGARINELLAVCPNDLTEIVHPQGGARQTLIRLKTLKHQRTATSGRPAKNLVRTVPLFDPDFTNTLKRYLVTHCSNKKLPIFGSVRDKSKPMSAETARQWFKKIDAANAASESPVKLLIELTPRSLRHSFAVHCLLHGIHIKRIQLYLGHSRMESTEIYTKLLTIDFDMNTVIRF
ncbi:resolvase [Vibrio sp. MACH09]|uniref:tyrosine-type recombinase/integrase n=1 Tax=Vibrio sp. MACH09 TaxID=3025122 RepID=UPI002793417A|nr:site-specific integrase [Vibrio sp. MACH09]GLO64206.1 resolvase [Vibrio sp. MACH09]